MFDRKELKQRAKAVMSRSYFMMFIACLAVSVVSGGGGGINFQNVKSLDMSPMSNVRMLLLSGIVGLLLIIGILFSIFLVSPLAVGLKKFMLNTAKGRCNLEDLLFPFKNNYKNILLTQFMKNLYVFLWSLPSFIPLAAYLSSFEKIAYLLEQVKADSVPAALTLIGMSSLTMLATLVLSVPAIIKELQYSMVSYILADDPDKNWKSAISQSKEMMVGNKWASIKLGFSFTGWYLLCFFLCCIGPMALTPYIEATYAQLYIYLSGQTADYDSAQAQQTNFFGGFSNF